MSLSKEFGCPPFSNFGTAPLSGGVCGANMLTLSPLDKL